MTAALHDETESAPAALSVERICKSYGPNQVLTDASADGWAYSKQFAQFGSITEAMVQKALPADPASAGAVGAFLGRYRTERAKVVASTPPIMMPPF